MYVCRAIPKWNESFGLEEDFNGDRESILYGPFDSIEESSEFGKKQENIEMFSTQLVVNPFGEGND